MEVLCVGLIILAILVFPFWAIFQIQQLKSREEMLEKRIDRLQKKLDGASKEGVVPNAQTMKSPTSLLRKEERELDKQRLDEEVIELDPNGEIQSEKPVVSPSPVSFSSSALSTPSKSLPPQENVPSIPTNIGKPVGAKKTKKEPEDWKVTVGKWASSRNEHVSKPKAAKPKKPAMSFERRMVWGAVWVGAIALVMAGVYLVKEAIESGWLGPTVRTVMTAGAGILALGIGEYLRRTQKQIAHGVTAAGVSLLYAALIGATTLHHLIPDSLGMVCMVGITALAVGLSLRHGPFVALLGLLGGFIMPKLLSTDSSSALQLFSYLIVLQVGLIAVTRYRGWYWLMFGTFLGGVIWSLLWILFVYQAADAHYVALFLMISTFAFLFWVPNALTAFSDECRNPVSLLLPWLTVLTAMGLFVVLIGKTNFSTTEWCYFGLLGAGCIVLARIQPRYIPAPVLSCILSVALIWGWQISGIEERLADFLWICTGLGSIYGVGAYIALWRSSRPEFWGWLSAVGGLAFLFIARYSVPTAQNWDWILLGVAGAYGAAAIPLIHRREKPTFGEALAALIIATTAGVAFSIQFALESNEIRWIWVGWCWALLLPVISGLMCRLKLRRLADLLLIVSFASSILLLLNQEVFEEDFGPHPIFNRLWLLYGIPLVSGLASRFLVGRGSEGDWLEKDYRRGLLGWLELFCVFMSFTLTTLLVRHGFNPEFTFRGTMRLLEMGLYANVWLMLAIVLTLLGRRGETLIPKGAALFIGWGTIGAMLLVATSLWFMIQFERTPTPDWSFPVLFFVFWVPAVLAFVFGELFNRDAREVPLRTLLEAAAWCLGLLALAVTIRRGFHVTPTDAFPNWWELTTYPLIWGVLALTILGIGLSLGRRWTRQIGEWLLLGAGVAHVVIVYVAWNPIWTHIDVGETPIANGVLYAFGGMVALGLVSLKILNRCGNRGAVITAGVFTQVAIFLLVSFEIRQWFHGAYLDGWSSSNAERYCYSAAWILLGIFLLILGIISKGKSVRFGSLAIMLIAVFKVFILDMRHLEDLWRVVSFLGLGVSLLTLVAVYQKFVFGDTNTLEEIERLDQESVEEEVEEDSPAE